MVFVIPLFRLSRKAGCAGRLVAPVSTVIMHFPVSWFRAFVAYL